MVVEDKPAFYTKDDDRILRVRDHVSYSDLNGTLYGGYFQNENEAEAYSVGTVDGETITPCTASYQIASTGPVLAVTLPENPGTGYSVVLEIRKADATIDRLTVNGDSGTAVSPLNMGEYQVDLGNGYSLTSVGNVTFIPYGTRAANGQLRVMKKAAPLCLFKAARSR